MVDVLPLALVGDTLGERLRFLNSMVCNAHQRNVALQSILAQPESAPIDRLFKIDLASKHRNVDFIIRNLKEKDMLYVSRALRCQWLLQSEYIHIINPVYLETYLYPEMLTTAVYKMKNYIELNLKDPRRCQEFYEYYKSNFDVAIKFLWHCSKEIIVEQVPNMIDKLTPKHLRILCEACPQVAKLYFDGLQNNKPALLRYLKSKPSYHSSIKNVLKVDGNLYLDLIEKYYNKDTLKQLSPVATRYIMQNYKNKYLSKPELYAAWLLHIKTLVMFLNDEEIKDIVFRLARAKYLGKFTYKQAEPFIKRLSVGDRELIKKQIFVDKSIGSMVETWPYRPPEDLKLFESHCKPFEDRQHYPHEYEHKIYKRSKCMKRFVKKKCCKQDYAYCMMSMPNQSPLDKLFDRYRFMNFDKVFFEFRKLLLIESTIEGRRNMILVLVSKAASNEAKLNQLMKFLVERHSNEAENLRDAIARSMVKRAFVWRLPAETWELLLKWANTSVREILHATVIRHLLTGTTCPPKVLESYLLDFSDLTEYSLNAAEKASIAGRLPALLVSANEPKIFLDILKTYNLRVDAVPGAVEMLINAAREDEFILRRVYQSRIARKSLLTESFKIIQTDAAYVNALRHDVSVLENGKTFVTLLSKEKPKHDRFLRALALYFSEADGLAAYHLNSIENAIAEDCRESFARPYAFLMNVKNKSLEDYINKIDDKTAEISKKKFAAALRANAFIARPMIDIDVIDWRAAGSKLVSNKALVCSDKDVNKLIQKSLKWKKTMRVALRLAPRIDSVREVLAVVIDARPTVALKFVLCDFRKGTTDAYMWNQIKPLILNLDLAKKSLQHVRRILGDLDYTSNIEADYWSTVFLAFRKANELDAMPMLCKMENVLTEIDANTINDIILDFLRDKLNKHIIIGEDFPKKCIRLYFRVIAKYLLISQSEEDQKAKIENICDPFFDKIELIFKGLESESKSKLIECLDDFLFSLKYSKAFLNNKYVSCMPMFERILERLSPILPREQYFQKYINIHLTMLYCRAIRQALGQRPEVFDPKLAQDEGVRTVGFIWGKYISIEIQDLVQNYFKSIVQVYKKDLLLFIAAYFENNRSVEKMVMSMIKGLMAGQCESQLLAQHVFADNRDSALHEDKQEIMKLLKDVDNEEMKFFLYADINPY